jgi:hypothetical protein
VLEHFAAGTPGVAIGHDSHEAGRIHPGG